MGSRRPSIALRQSSVTSEQRWLRAPAAAEQPVSGLL
jgi:hypothetical protein